MLIWAKNKENPEKQYCVSVDAGIDNLEAKDFENGFVGYLDYYVDEFVGHATSNCGFQDYESGMYLFKENKLDDEGVPMVEAMIQELLDYIFEYEDGDMTYVILDNLDNDLEG